jgi:hypothetical protein
MPLPNHPIGVPHRQGPKVCRGEPHYKCVVAGRKLEFDVPQAEELHPPSKSPKPHISDGAAGHKQRIGPEAVEDKGVVGQAKTATSLEGTEKPAPEGPQVIGIGEEA